MTASTSFLLALILPLVTANSPHYRAQIVRSSPTVTLHNGTVEGIHVPSYNQDAFLGIPFAEPPVRDLRFAPPQYRRAKWNGSNGTLQAKDYYPKCVGYGNEQTEPGVRVSEDCLVLNVVRPTGAGSGYGEDGERHEGLPVAVWIHGGAFSQGGTMDTLYNISYMIQNGIEINKPFIGITIQYRLNAFGFLGGKEVREAGATNLGIRDQRLALQWVRENIAEFGGNPDRVTIFGESAGAASVGIQLIAYEGRDDKLFSGAIMESGAPLLLGPKYNASLEQSKYDVLAEATGCSNSTKSLQCLRYLDYDTLNTALNGTAASSFFPYTDGDLIQGSVYDQLEAGQFTRVPIIIGTNTDEGLFTALSLSIDTDADFRAAVAGYGSNVTIPFIEAVYPDIPAIGIPEWWDTIPTNRGKQTKRWAAFSGDYTFIAPRRLTCQRWAQYNVSAYCYRFNGDLPAVLPTSGATHWVEVAYVFYNLQRMGFGAQPVPKNYERLAKLVSSMWVSFFSEHDPNGHDQSGIAHWPVYNDAVGGYAQNFAFDVNVTSKPERDTWRAEGIAYLNKAYGAEYNK